MIHKFGKNIRQKVKTDIDIFEISW